MDDIAARSNELGVSRGYDDSYVIRTTTVKRNGSVTFSDIPTTRRNHYCQRSQLVKGVYHTVPNTSTVVRRATDYYRTVYDVSRDPYTEQDVFVPTHSSALATREMLCTSRVSDFSAAGGLLNSWTMNFDQEGRNAARTKALNKLGDQKLQLSVDIAEAKKTYNLIAELSTTLWKGLHYAKRGQWKALQRELGLGSRDVYSGKASSRRLLEMQYGWMPLMSSIKGAYDLLSDQTYGKALLMKARASQTYPFSFEGDHAAFRYAAKGSRRYSCGITATMSSSFSRTLDRAGLINPLQLGWELVPYSFVLDWGIPVGNVLQGMSATLGLQFVDGYEADVGTAELLTYPKGTATSSYTRNVYASVGATHRWKSFYRRGLTSFPIPGLYGKPDPFTTSHSIAALALFRNLFK